MGYAGLCWPEDRALLESNPSAGRWLYGRGPCTARASSTPCRKPRKRKTQAFSGLRQWPSFLACFPGERSTPERVLSALDAGHLGKGMLFRPLWVAGVLDNGREDVATC